MTRIQAVFKYFFFLIPFLGMATLLEGQTCCSGGVPLSGNVGLTPGNKGDIQFRLSYDLNVLRRLKFGSEILDDNSRTRTTGSILLQTGYSITDNISLEAFIPLVSQRRVIRQNGFEDLTSTFGMGDVSLLLKYKWLAGRYWTITHGAGVKAPTGPSDLSDEDGFTINADLQPGSGAWDGLFWSQAFYLLRDKGQVGLTSTVIYALKGKNDDYLDAFTYKFGDEFRFHTGLGGRLSIGKKAFPLDVSGQLQYRMAKRDEQENIALVNTGGHWLFLRPETSFWLKPSFAIFGAMDIPLYSKVDGTQLSPTIRMTVGVFYRRLEPAKAKDILYF